MCVVPLLLPPSLQDEVKAAGKQLAEAKAQLAVAKASVSAAAAGGAVSGAACVLWLLCCRMHAHIAHALPWLLGAQAACLRVLPRVFCAQALASRAAPGPSGAGQVLVETLPGLDAKALQEAAASLLGQLQEPAVVVLASPGEGDAAGKVSFVAALSPQAVAAGMNAGRLVGTVAKVCGGGGGGKPNLAQAGGKDASKLPEALRVATDAVMDGLKVA